MARCGCDVFFSFMFLLGYLGSDDARYLTESIDHQFTIQPRPSPNYPLLPPDL